MLSLIVPCYNVHPTLLAWQLEAWREYPPDVELILVDDCSLPPLGLELAGELMPQVRLTIARVEEGIPWNQPGARNLGAHLARGEWLLFCDADHRFDADDMLVISAGVHSSEPTGDAYYFRRVEIDKSGERTPIGSHLGTVLIKAERFREIGGWDEDFSGHYGFDDHWFSHCLGRHYFFLGPRTHTLLPFANKDQLRQSAHNKALFGRKVEELRAGTYRPGPRMRFKWTCLISAAPS